MSTDISVSGQPDGSFAVVVRQGATRTEHVVTVPPGLATQVGADGVADVRIVEASFEFLLEREPATSILRSFGLEVIERYFPEYRSELSRRLAAGGA